MKSCFLPKTTLQQIDFSSCLWPQAWKLNSWHSQGDGNSLGFKLCQSRPSHLRDCCLQSSALPFARDNKLHSKENLPHICSSSWIIVNNQLQFILNARLWTKPAASLSVPVWLTKSYLTFVLLSTLIIVIWEVNLPQSLAKGWPCSEQVKQAGKEHKKMLRGT